MPTLDLMEAALARSGPAPAPSDGGADSEAPGPADAVERVARAVNAKACAQLGWEDDWGEMSQVDREDAFDIAGVALAAALDVLAPAAPVDGLAELRDAILDLDCTGESEPWVQLDEVLAEIDRIAARRSEEPEAEPGVAQAMRTTDTIARSNDATLRTARTAEGKPDGEREAALAEARNPFGKLSREEAEALGIVKPRTPEEEQKLADLEARADALAALIDEREAQQPAAPVRVEAEGERVPVGTELVAASGLVWTVLADDGTSYVLGHGERRIYGVASLKHWPSPESWRADGEEPIYPAPASVPVGASAGERPETIAAWRLLGHGEWHLGSPPTDNPQYETAEFARVDGGESR